MKNKQFDDFSFKAAEEIEEQIRSSMSSIKQSFTKIQRPQKHPRPINYRHLNTLESPPVTNIFGKNINSKIKNIDKELEQNIKRRIQLESKLNQMNQVEKKRTNRSIFMVESNQLHKQIDEQINIFQKIEKKAEKIERNIKSQKLENQSFKQLGIEIKSKKDDIEEKKGPIKGQKIIIGQTVVSFAKNKKPIQTYTIPNQIKIQQLLQKVTFPRIPNGYLLKYQQEINNLFAVHSPHSDIYYLLMIINFHLQKYQKVREYFKQILNFKIFNQTAYWISAQTQFILQNYQLCLSLTEDCLKNLEDKLLPRILFLKGKCFEQTGNFINSVICFNQLIKIKPKISEYYLERGILYHRMGYYKQSKEDLVMFGLLNPESKKYLEERILSEKNEGRKKQYLGILAKMY